MAPPAPLASSAPMAPSAPVAFRSYGSFGSTSTPTSMSISISQSINQSIYLSFYLSICLSMYLTLSYSILPYLTLSFPILPYLILSFPFYSIFPILRMNVSWPCDALQGGGAAPWFLFYLESYVGTAWVLSIFIYAVKAQGRYRVILWTPLMWRFAGGGAAPSHRAPLPPFYLTPPPRLVTTPERWMIRPTYIANECIMTMWRFAGGGAAPFFFAPSSAFLYLKAPPAACDNARKVDDKAHLHCEWMCHDHVTQGISRGGGQTCGSCWVTLVIVENTKHTKRTNQATEQPSNWPAN